MSIRSDYAARAATSINSDLQTWGISQRQAAKRIGIALSTLNAFLNRQHNAHHGHTLRKLLESPLWSENTYDLLAKLAKFDDLAFTGQIALTERAGIPDFHVIDGGKSDAASK